MNRIFRFTAFAFAFGVMGISSPIKAADIVPPLLAWYEFEDPNDLGKDSGSFGNNGTVVDNGFVPIWNANGIRGGAAQFRGTIDAGLGTGQGGSIRIPFNTGPVNWPDLTWGTWVKPDYINNIRDILNNDDGGYDRCLNIDSRAGGNYAAFVNNGPWPFNSGVAPVSGITPSDPWVFIAGVYRQNFYGTNQGKLTMYVGDQIFDDIRTYYGNTGWTFTSLGASPTFGEFWSGLMDDVVIYGGALTPNQMQLLKTGGPSNVPEPSTYVLGAIASGTLAWLARRKKSRMG